MSEIEIKRWEPGKYTAVGHGMSASGTSKQSAELNLLRKIIAIFELKIVIRDWMPEENHG